MKIDSANINMTAAHTLVQKYQKSEELRMWIGEQDPQNRQAAHPVKDKITLTEEAKNYLAKNQDISKTADEQPVSGEDGKIMLIKLLVEAFTGKKIDLKHIQIKDDQNAVETNNAPQKADAGPQTEKQGWGVVYNSHESRYEHEEMSFNAEGVVKTQDGKEIKFSLQVEMDREFVSEENISIRAGDAVLTDPLVINFSGPAADLTGVKFAFDLNSDGNEESISSLRSGSGFLALDINNDGKVNNGAELFGPQTGSGFGELAAYDEDKNNWIDENDPVYEKLRIWTKAAEGTDYLNTLKEQNVGAIFLGNVNSAFDLKDEDNNLQGQVATTGVYLNENGTPGTVQQVNIVA